MTEERFERLAAELNTTASQLLKRAREADRELGISGPRLSALSVLVATGEQTLAALAETEQVAAPSMSRLVDGLEREGLAVREPNPDDRRSIIVRVTDRGREMLRRGQRARAKRLMAELQALPDTEIVALERAVAALRTIQRGTG